MKQGEQRISEADLHAYVDDRLDGERRAAVEAFLAENPREAQRLQDYRGHNDLLRALYDPVLQEPVPPPLQAFAVRRFRPAVLRHAGLAASLLVGVLIGWLLRGEDAGRTLIVSSFAQNAALAHVAYAPEVLHPVEVGAAQEAHLIKWLSKRLGVPVRVPQLGFLGFDLVGGRLLPGAARPAAQLMYQDSRGQRLTLYLRTDLEGDRETAFRYMREDGLGVFYWLDGPVGYALVGDLERERLLAVAQAVYHDLEG